MEDGKYVYLFIFVKGKAPINGNQIWEIKKENFNFFLRHKNRPVELKVGSKQGQEETNVLSVLNSLSFNGGELIDK